MKKSAAFFALLALCLLPLGCNRFEESPVPEQVSNQLDAEAPASSWDEDVVLFDPAGFTQAQMLEDYDYFWDTILANCPLMAAYPQQMGQRKPGCNTGSGLKSWPTATEKGFPPP